MRLPLLVLHALNACALLLHCPPREHGHLCQSEHNFCLEEFSRCSARCARGRIRGQQSSTSCLLVGTLPSFPDHSLASYADTVLPAIMHATTPQPTCSLERRPCEQLLPSSVFQCQYVVDPCCGPGTSMPAFWRPNASASYTGGLPNLPTLSTHATDTISDLFTVVGLKL